MKNNKKNDMLSVNNIASPNEIRAVSQKPTGNAEDDPFCVYAHQRHAVGSKIKTTDGIESECTNEGSWKNTGGSKPKSKS